uniref:Ig-like domain-containing protein n=1 Tax=Myripristis murdjan TaxID=586833 RepID=A0A667XVT2_9TELE
MPYKLIRQFRLVSAGRSVTFENPNPCALRGSSVEFGCSYDYPDGETVHKTTWSKGGLKDGRWIRTNLSSLPSYGNRVEYLGDRQHNCSLVISDLTIFRRICEYLFDSSGLKASVYPGSVTAGENVTLQCSTTCQLPRPPNIVWFRDGQHVAKPKFQARAEDAGNYSCAVEGHESVTSDPVALDVLYAPVKVLVEVSHDDNLAEGSSVNLTCSSVANPAADSYTWYRRTGSPNSSLELVGSGQVLSLPSMEPSHTGHYLCRARNPLGEESSAELLLLSQRQTPILGISFPNFDLISFFILFSVNSVLAHSLILRVGFAVKTAVLLMLPLVLVWVW